MAETKGYPLLYDSTFAFSISLRTFEPHHFLALINKQ